MTEEDVRRAYVRIRKIDNTIPDEVLDLMRDSALEKLREMKLQSRRDRLAEIKNGDFLTDKGVPLKRTFAPKSKPRNER